MVLSFHHRRHLKLYRSRRCDMVASCQPNSQSCMLSLPLLVTLSLQVLETIFSTLSAHEVLLLAPVCHAWRVAAHSSVLWGERLGTRAAAACNLSKGERQHPQQPTGDSSGNEGLNSIADLGLASLGPAISLPTASLALHERNFHFNPCFKKTSALEAMFRPGGWVRGRVFTNLT